MPAALEEEVPSTVADENPLAESLARIMGKNPLSQTTGTASPISYDPEQSFRQPQADVINISGSPGTGATTPETWSHDIALENLKREQLQFEYEQQQNAIANELRQQEALRAQTQLGLSQAEAARAAGLYSTQKATAQQQLASARQDMALKAAAEERAKMESYAKYGGITADQMKAAYQNQAYVNQFSRDVPYRQQEAVRQGTQTLLGSGAGASAAGLNVRYAKNPGGGTPGMAGTVTSSGYYIPIGTGQSIYMGKPGSESWNQYMNAFAKGV